jgi:hypothetical protein
MSKQLEGFEDAIFGQLSQIGIEILPDNNCNGNETFLPKAIYEMTKKSSIDYSGNQKVNK